MEWLQRMGRRDGGWPRGVWLLLVIADVVALYWLVWTPADAHHCDATTSLIGRAFCLGPALTWVGNILLLVPTALLLAVGLPRVRTSRIAAATLLATITIEVVQHWIPGRDPDWRDVATNALGAWLAVTLARRLLPATSAR